MDAACRFSQRTKSLPSIRRTGQSAILGVALTILALGTVHADPIEDRSRELLLWVADETGYDLGGTSVTIVVVEPKVINIVAHGTAYVDQMDKTAMAIGSAILLPDWFELGRHDDVLVHELTHVLQHTNNAQFRCHGEQEREAYETAAAFTEQTGIGTKPSRWFMVMLRCIPNWKD